MAFNALRYRMNGVTDEHDCNSLKSLGGAVLIALLPRRELKPRVRS